MWLAPCLFHVAFSLSVAFHVACSLSVKSLIKCHHLREAIHYHPKEQDSYTYFLLLCLDPFLHGTTKGLIIYFVLPILVHFPSSSAQGWLYKNKHHGCTRPMIHKVQLMVHIQWIIMATEDHWWDLTGTACHICICQGLEQSRWKKGGLYQAGYLGIFTHL